MKKDLVLVKEILKLYTESPNEDSGLICQNIKEIEDKELKHYLDEVIVTSEERKEDIDNATKVLSYLAYNHNDNNIFKLVKIVESISSDSLMITLKKVVSKMHLL